MPLEIKRLVLKNSSARSKKLSLKVDKIGSILFFVLLTNVIGCDRSVTTFIKQGGASLSRKPPEQPKEVVPQSISGYAELNIGKVHASSGDISVDLVVRTNSHKMRSNEIVAHVAVGYKRIYMK